MCMNAKDVNVTVKILVVKRIQIYFQILKTGQNADGTSDFLISQGLLVIINWASVGHQIPMISFVNYVISSPTKTNLSLFHFHMH